MSRRGVLVAGGVHGAQTWELRNAPVSLHMMPEPCRPLCVFLRLSQPAAPRATAIAPPRHHPPSCWVQARPERPYVGRQGCLSPDAEALPDKQNLRKWISVLGSIEEKWYCAEDITCGVKIMTVTPINALRILCVGALGILCRVGVLGGGGGAFHTCSAAYLVFQEGSGKARTRRVLLM